MQTSTTTDRSTKEPPEPHWIHQAAFAFLSIALVLGQVALWFALRHEWYWLAVPLVVVLGHIMHGQLVGFHEASHGMLRKNRLLNDLDGLFIGTLSFMSFTLYRAIHQTHHMHLASERDEELWPFNRPGTPRWQRRLAALFELFGGLIGTPLLFVRSFLRKGSPVRSPKVRRRIWAEFAFMGVVWSAVLAAVAWFGVWRYFCWLYLLPAVLAGSLQSWRKYIEHVGMTGSSVRSSTRSIVAGNLLGRLVSFTLLHEPYHGVHHQRAGLPHGALPLYASDLAPQADDEIAPFPSYGSALRHLLRHLPDPRVGAQWRRYSEASH